MPKGARAVPVVYPVVHCWRLRATLSATTCATRAGARIPSGGGRGAVRFHPCGNCPDGALVLAELESRGWRRPKDTIPAELPDRPQQLARVRYARTFPSGGSDHDGPDPRDPLDTAARMTPDDPWPLSPDPAGLS